MKRNYYPFNHLDCLEIEDNKAVVIINRALKMDSYENLSEEMQELLNKINNSDFVQPYLCGYVDVSAKKMHPDLHELYSENYLDLINIPGGITYCEPVIKNKKLYNVALDMTRKKMKDWEYMKHENQDDYVKGRFEIKKQFKKDIRDIGYESIVYGFDCAHDGHNDIVEYQDVKFILKLCGIMEEQLFLLSDRFEELKEAKTGKEKQKIIDEIRSKSPIPTDMSPIAILNFLMKNKGK